jgi:hypothetical protein
MSMIKYIPKEAWYIKLIKIIMFIFAGAIVAGFLRGYIAVWSETQGGIFQLELTIDMASYALGYLLAYVTLYALAEGVKSEWK